MPESSRTMMRRYLAEALAWSSPRYGRWVLVLILLVYFAILAALIGSRGSNSAWRTVGVAAHPIKFYGALFIATAAESHRAGCVLGHDVLAEEEDRDLRRFGLRTLPDRRILDRRECPGQLRWCSARKYRLMSVWVAPMEDPEET
jgi:hypothetical protein